MFRSSIIANFRFRCSFNSLLIYNQCQCLQDRRIFSIVFFQLVLNKALESISELSLDRILCLLTLVLRLGNSRLVHKPSPIIYLPLVRTFVSTSCSFKNLKQICTLAQQGFLLHFKNQILLHLQNAVTFTCTIQLVSCAISFITAQKSKPNPNLLMSLNFILCAGQNSQFGPLK